jgi:hypothetical protein
MRIDLQKHWCSWQGMHAKCLEVNQSGDSCLVLRSAEVSDAELGLNTFIKRDGGSKYVVVPGARIALEDKPIASTKAIVCRGTTCYRGRRSDLTGWEYMVKFA